MMDEITRRRHNTKPDLDVTVRITAVNLPDGQSSYHLQVPQGRTLQQWGKLFITLARICFRQHRQGVAKQK
jgi:hypothetical protein